MTGRMVEIKHGHRIGRNVLPIKSPQAFAPIAEPDDIVIGEETVSQGFKL
jgi:hypothetical protein